MKRVSGRPEWGCAGQDLAEDGSEGDDVRTFVQVLHLPEGLLRRHGGGGPEDRAGDGVGPLAARADGGDGGHLRRLPPCPGAVVDAAIGKLVIETVQPAALDIAIAVQDEIEKRIEEADRIRAAFVQRAQYKAKNTETPPSGSALVERMEIDQRLVQAVLELKEPYRSTILSRFFEDLTAGEIAKRHRVPLETVRSRIKRGLEQLRRSLEHDLGADIMARGLGLIIGVAPGATPYIPSGPAAGLLGGMTAVSTKTVMTGAALLMTGILATSLWLVADGPARPGTQDHLRPAPVAITDEPGTNAHEPLVPERQWAEPTTIVAELESEREHDAPAPDLQIAVPPVSARTERSPVELQPDGPRLTQAAIDDLRLLPWQVESLHQILQTHYRDYVTLQSLYLQRTWNGDHLMIHVGEFSKEGNDLEKRLWNDMDGILDETQRLDAKSELVTPLRNVFEGFGAHARQFELWKSGTSYTCKETEVGPDGTPVRVMSQGGPKLPVMYARYWEDRAP
ncbi:MAG: sigma factor-like helix-turn-helix DNA-binding protein [Planctomycetota bacterium]